MTEFIVKLAQAGTVGDRQMNKSRRQLINGGDVGGRNLPGAVFPLGGIITDQREERVEAVHHIELLDVVVCLMSNERKKNVGMVLKRDLKGGETAGEQTLNDEERDADGTQREEECESVNEAGE